MKLSLRLILSSIFLLATVTLQFTGCKSDKDEPKGPHIESISPVSGTSKTRVVITGSGLAADGETTTVKFNGVPADVRSVTDNEVAVFAPDADSGPVTVTIGTTVLTGPDYSYVEPMPAVDYFIKFKADNRWKIYQVAEPGFSACYQCSCSVILQELVSDENSGEIYVCFNEGDMQVTSDMIRGLKDQTIGFSTIFPQAEVHYDVDGVDYSSEGVTQPSSSKMTITDMASDGGYGDHPAFKVSGTFSCKVQRVDGTEVVTITDGSFTVRFTEDFW